MACFLCRPEMSDPLTTVNSYMRNPGALRACCTFLFDCYDHSIYLEGLHCCPFATIGRAPGTKEDGEEAPPPRQFPVLLRNCKEQAPMRAHLHISCLPNTTLTKNDIPNTFPFITISHMHHLTRVGHCCFASTTKLKEVVLDHCPVLEELGESFLEQGYTGVLNKVSLRNLPSLRKIGAKFMYDARGVAEFSMCNLPQLTSVGASWLDGAKGLGKLRVGDLPKLRTIGACFARRTLNLRSVVLENLPALTFIDSGCFSGSGVRQVKVSNLPRLLEIRGTFLVSCSQLEEVTMEDLPALTTVGPDWLRRSVATLKHLRVANLPALALEGCAPIPPLEEGEDGGTSTGCAVEIEGQCHPSVVAALSPTRGEGH